LRLDLLKRTPVAATPSIDAHRYRVMNETKIMSVLKALADSNRFRMVRDVSRAGELTCGQIGRRFALSQPTVSHHLKVLVDAGVLLVRHEAQQHFLSVDRGLLETIAALLPGARARKAGTDPLPNEAGGVI
jgi:ArsR family transcriptional regulator